MCHQIWKFTRYLLLNMNSDLLVVTVAVVQLLSCVQFYVYGLQHSRLLCPPLYVGVCSNLWPLSWWCSLIISSSLNPFFFLPSIFLSSGVFYNESALCIRQPKDWSFSFSPFNDYSIVDSFRIDWFDPLAVQGTLKSLLQHYNSKASVLQFSTFFMIQLSHPYMTTGKTIALTIWTFVGKVMSLIS